MWATCQADLRLRLTHVLTIGAIGLCSLLLPPATLGESPPHWTSARLEEFVQLYRELHAAPELSRQEENTSKRLAELWKATGANVTERVGGWGVVAKIENGTGPTIMLRTDMDALPVVEDTGLIYASKVVTAKPQGGSTGVMHACGHDMHMTCVTGALRYLAEHRKKWSGTLMVIGQPAEELGEGARAMLKDQLFERFGKPNIAVALHCGADLAVNKIGLTEGFAMANVDDVDITIYGRGGHGAYPSTTIDPIVIAARLILDLQTIVSREVNPLEPAVITVGSISGGTKHNIIGPECKLQLTVRSYGKEAREQLRTAIVRKVKAAAESSGAPEPKLEFDQGTDALRNDIELTRQVRERLQEVFGPENVLDQKPSMGGEDFSAYGNAGVPICMFKLGTVAEDRLARAKLLGEDPPSLHSPKYYPEAEPSLKMGITALTEVALHLLAKRDTATGSPDPKVEENPGNP